MASSFQKQPSSQKTTKCRKKGQGATRVELVTSRSAVECSATELYPRLVILLRKIEVNVRCASIDGVCCNLATLESALFSLY